jgi:ER lumen protein retaining receptor
MLIVTRGFIPSALHPDSSTQDEDVKCTPAPTLRLHQLTLPQSASGISFKSQLLYLIVYLTRYVDLLWTFYEPKSLYNTVFKIIFISTSAYTVYLMLNEYKPTHDPNLDTFKVQYLLGASAVLAVLFPYKYTFSEVGCTI